MPADEARCDLLVIGAGSGGVRAARRAAGHGAKVIVVEAAQLGGTCVNAGCVPKKLFHYAARFPHEFSVAADYGWRTDTPPVFDWNTLREHKDQEILRLNGVYEQLLQDTGVRIIRGKARLADAHAVHVGSRRYHAERILIATGGQPWVPDFPGKEHVITSAQAFHLEELPRRALVVGGGYIALEFAGIFHGLGVDTELLYRGDLFLRGFDQESRTVLAEELRKHGQSLRFQEEVQRIDQISADASGELRATLRSGETMDADLVFYATGRKPNTQGLGLEQAGVELDGQGRIRVDHRFQSNIPSIHAIGDVSNRHNLTPVAIAEAERFVRLQFGNQKERHGDRGASQDLIPTCVFSSPSFASVGYGEEDARKEFSDVTCTRSRFRPLKLSMGEHAEQCFMKRVMEGPDQRLIGLHIIAEDAAEMLQGFVAAMHAGIDRQTMDQTLGIHPSSAEELFGM